MAYDRIHNFSAGPAVLPVSVLEKAQSELLNFQGSGMSIMEMSHRSKTFESVLEAAKSGVRDVLSIPDNYDILFLQGGASLQFSMIPMNLASKDQSIDVVNTGSWTKKAIKEFKKEASCNVIASSEDKNFSYIPKADTLSFNSDAAFAYLTSNNTIAGTQWTSFPDTGNVPLVADMSSDIFSKPIDVSKFGAIFAGAQKNCGPSGVTIVIIRKDLIERAPDSLPSMLQYRNFSANNSLYNTPPSFGIYMISLVMEWIQEQGGIHAIEKHNEEKAALLYDLIEGSDFYVTPVASDSRSLMNIVFRVRNDETLEAAFIKEAAALGISGIKGHRSVGGLRASIYNAQPKESVQALANFMKDFQERNA